MKYSKWSREGQRVLTSMKGADLKTEERKGGEVVQEGYVTYKRRRSSKRDIIIFSSLRM